MQLTVQQVWDITLLVSAVIREKRPMPQRGKFLLARMHAKLMTEFTPISERRDALIKEYDHRDEGGAEWSVPADRMDDFTAKWKDIASIVIDVDLSPVRLSDLDIAGVNGGIEASELLVLGDVVIDG